MRDRLKIGMAGLLAALALGALTASTASALPEYARCLAKAGGKYEDANCQTKAAAGKGAYELSKVVEHTGVSGHATTLATLATAGGSELKCAGARWTGNLDVVKGVTKALNHVVIRFTGCELPISPMCHTEGAAEKEIVTNELEGKLGYISKTARTVEQELKPMSTAPGKLFLTFECGGGAVLVKEGKGTGGGGGCIFTPIEPTNVMTSALTEQLLGTGGVQSPNKLEGSTRTCNLESSANGGKWERATIATSFALTPEEGVEIRA